MSLLIIRSQEQKTALLENESIQHYTLMSYMVIEVGTLSIAMMVNQYMKVAIIKGDFPPFKDFNGSLQIVEMILFTDDEVLNPKNINTRIVL